MDDLSSEKSPEVTKAGPIAYSLSPVSVSFREDSRLAGGKRSTVAIDLQTCNTAGWRYRDAEYDYLMRFIGKIDGLFDSSISAPPEIRIASYLSLWAPLRGTKYPTVYYASGALILAHLPKCEACRIEQMLFCS